MISNFKSSPSCSTEFITPSPNFLWNTVIPALNFVKSTRKKKVVYSDEIVHSTSDQPKENDELDLLRQLVNELPEKYKTVIILFYFEKMKTHEISVLLKISEAAVRKQLERARDILKSKMEAYHE